MARTVGTQSIIKLFQNLATSKRVSHVKLAPLAELFDKKPTHTKTEPTTQPHSILDIYKIDETKKWVVAVRDSQKKKLLRRRFADSVTNLFQNWGRRHYSSRYADTKAVPPIEVFHLTQRFNQDKFDKKVNLGVGAYRTDEGKPWVLPVVKKAEKLVVDDKSFNKEYLPISGYPAFTEAASKLVLTPESKALKEGKAFGYQCLSGTGSLRVAAQTLHRVLGCKTYYVSKPTWGNHNNIFQHAGFTTKKEYTYWDPKIRGINFDGLLCDLCAAEKNSVIIFHSCAHNPTGSDPTQEQWKEIAEIVKEKGLFPLFDTAYLGFASGDILQDGFAPRYFVEQGVETIICQSFAKNFGLYCERVGNCIFVIEDTKFAPALKSQINIIIRSNYSNPPAHGARVVAKILNDPNLYEEWLVCLTTMACRVFTMRKLLRSNLEKLKTPGSWKHITDQIGMFSFTGLNEAQSKNMVEKHHVYMLKSGRINMCGITPSNVEYVAQSIHESVTNVK